MDQIHLKRYGVCYLFKVFSVLITISVLILCLLILLAALYLQFQDEYFAAFGAFGITAVAPLLPCAIASGASWFAFARACKHHEQAYLAASSSSQNAA